MPKLKPDDVKMWQGLVDLWEKKRSDLHDPRVQRNWALYQGRVFPRPYKDVEGSLININVIHANKKIEKPSIFVRDPKIYVKAKKSRIPTGAFDLAGTEVVLDGNRLSRTLREGHNNHFGENRVKYQIERVRDDALIGKYGVLYVNYNAEIGIDDEENPFIQEEQIINMWLPPDRFIYDPELSDFDLSYARFCGRIIDMPLEDVLDNTDYYENLKGLEDTAFFSKELLGDEALHAQASSLKTPSQEHSLQDYTYLKKVRLYELWIKPTLKEKKDRRNPYRRGKVLVLAKGYDRALRVDRWLPKIDGFPFEILTFNRINGQFMPLSDIEIYEHLAAEKNLLRTYQLEQAKVAGNFRIFYDTDKIDSGDIEKARKADNQFIGVKGSLKDAFFSLTPGSVSGEYYTADSKVDRDFEVVSGLPDIRRGIASSSERSATETALLDRNSGSISTERLGTLVDFIRSVVKKNTQLMKQYYDRDKMLELTGLPEEDLEWPDSWNEEAIKDDMQVEIDVQSMVPISEAVVRKQALDIMMHLINMINSPAVMQKLADEGVTLSLTEALKEFKDAFQIKNEDILQFLTPEQKSKLEERLALERGQAPSSPSGGVPTEASETSRAHRTGAQALQGVV